MSSVSGVLVDATTPPVSTTPRSVDLQFAEVLRKFWHPVCSVAELADHARSNTQTDVARTGTGVGPMPATLLGVQLAVAITDDGTPLALADRCVHRSTRLSVGVVVGETIRCGYHGWRYDATGRCVDIPAMPAGPIPGRACVMSYSAAVAYGLLWVRLDDSLNSEIPPCAAWVSAEATDPELRVLPGQPYTWPVGAPRRVENFVDLSHFAWVHDGSLGRRDEPVPPLPDIERVGSALEFRYESPDMDPDGRALFGSQHYLMAMPLTVQITFRQRTGGKRILWMTASPITMDECRSFWFVSRNDALDEDDAEHLRFQDQILQEDEPVVCNQVPAALSLETTAEVSVRTDRVSIEYRRFLRDLALASDNPEQLSALIARRSPVSVG